MAEHAYAIVNSTFADFLAGDLLVKPAEQAWEKAGYYALRRAVFSQEQQLLGQDKDDKDFSAIAIVAVAHHCGMPDQVIGAVRIYQPEPLAKPGLWYGGRLCVAKAYRRHAMIGKALVNEAVSRAIELGCERFLATVQVANQGYFHSLHWRSLEALDLLGQPHILMQAHLPAYPLQQRQVSLPTHTGDRHAS